MPDTLRRARATISEGGHAGGLLLAVVLGVCYLALAHFVLRLNDPVTAGANFWPAAGLTLGTLLLLPTRRWPWALAAIALAEVTSDILMDYSVEITASLVVADTVEPLLGATLIRNFTQHRGRLVPFRGLLEFIAFGVVAAPLVGGSIGTIGSVQSGADLWQAWPRFIIADALGVLVVAPVLLTFRESGQGRSVQAGLVFTGATLVISLVALRNWPGGWDTVTPYLVIPILTWAALRSGIRGAAWSVLAMGQVANLAVANGTEPFEATMDTGYTVTLLQAYLTIVASTTLILASATSELRARDTLEAALRRQALHDPLTGLPNRLYLKEHLVDYLESAGAAGVTVAMCVIDLDSFKSVNDSFGHPTGDELLVATADRLRDTVRESDLVARLGGDEFVVLLGGASDAAIDAITARIVERVSAPLVASTGVEVVTAVSVGVATSSEPAAFDHLFRAADAALYRAKAQGRNQVVRVALDPATA